MKLNLSKLNNDSQSNQSAPTKINLKNISAPAQDAQIPRFSKINIEKLNSEIENVDSSPVITKLNTEALTTADNGFHLSFTDGEEYNLDDIIYEKRRNNADCPLIVYVRNNNTNDELVVAQITKMILDDYDVSYSDDKESNNYYKKVVYKVPGFSIVFNNYMATYYKIYVDNLYNLQEGTISLGDVTNKISQTYDLYGKLKNNEKLKYAGDVNYGVFNKPSIQYSYGSDYSDADENLDDDTISGTDIILENWYVDVASCPYFSLNKSAPSIIIEKLIPCDFDAEDFVFAQ